MRKIFSTTTTRDRLHNLEQAGILVLSAAAIIMINLGPNDHWRFWGNVVGLLASPLWFHASWMAKPRQWGQFALSFAYLANWIVGLYRYA